MTILLQINSNGVIILTHVTNYAESMPLHTRESDENEKASAYIWAELKERSEAW